MNRINNKQLEHSLSIIRQFIHAHGSRILWTVLMVDSVILLSGYHDFWSTVTAYTGLFIGIFVPSKEVLIRWTHKF